jgi:hypothetical protein
VTGSSEREAALDGLARAMAGDLSRRRLVGMALAATATAMLPSWVWRTGVAHAGSLGARGTCVAYPETACGPDYNDVTYTTAGMSPYTIVIPSGTDSTFNGCGPAGGIDVGRLHGLEPPDTPLGLAHFADACNTHDCCYGDCQHAKDKCDSGFAEGMAEACGANIENLLTGIGAAYCTTIAAAYYAAVAAGGSQAYEAAQRQACRACQPKCQCTGNQGCCNALHDDYTCFDLDTDASHCGDCGHPCSPGETCSAGRCI